MTGRLQSGSADSWWRNWRGGRLFLCTCNAWRDCLRKWCVQFWQTSCQINEVNLSIHSIQIKDWIILILNNVTPSFAIYRCVPCTCMYALDTRDILSLASVLRQNGVGLFTLLNTVFRHKWKLCLQHHHQSNKQINTE